MADPSRARIPSILYDARTVAPGMTGVGRYALNLLAALAADPAAPPIRAFFAPEALPLVRRDPRLVDIEPLAAPCDHTRHPQGELWLETSARRAQRPGEVFLGPGFLCPGLLFPFMGARGPRVVTIHDATVFTHPGCYPPGFRRWLAWAIRRSAHAADLVLTLTEAAAAELAAAGVAPRDKLRAIHLAPDATGEPWESLVSAESTPPALDEPLAEDAIVVLSVGTLEARKQPDLTRRALLELAANCPRPLRWWWLGNVGPLDVAPDADLAARAIRAGWRHLAGAASAQRQCAYAEADLFVSASLAEGFNLPVVEAMSAGLPLVLSDILVHREVAGDAALYFPPGDPVAMAAALQSLLDHPARAADLATRARARAGRFSWAQTAARTLEALHEAAAVR